MKSIKTNPLKIVAVAAMISVGVSQNTLAGSTMVTDAAGTQELWTFQEVLGTQKLVSKINQTDNKGETYTWDANGNMLTETDAEGRETTYTYNTSNQRTSKTEASGTPQARTTTYEYISPDIDLVTKISSPSVRNGSVKELINTYDANQNITMVTLTGFDLLGNAVSRSTSFQHDALGKVTQIDGPRTDVNDITKFEYYECSTGAECGQLRTLTNALGHTTTYDSYDAAGRLLQMTDPNGVVTAYSYHPRGWLLSKTQSVLVEGSITLERITRYEYDNAGQLTEVTSPDGSKLIYAYDAAHYLRFITDNFGNSIEYRYDSKGNRTHKLIKNTDGTLVNSSIAAYDMRDFVESVNRGGSITQMLNNAVGNLGTLIDPNENPSTVHSYDALDRLRDTVDALSNNTGYQYNVADQITQVTAPNGAVTQYEYDDLGNHTREVSADRGTVIYTFDAAGNVITAMDARGVIRTWSYDVLNRVTQLSYPNVSENTSYLYDGCSFGVGRLCQVTDQAGSSQYSYSAFGNIFEELRIELGYNFSTRYKYDDADRIIEIKYPDNRLVTYTRDAIGRVVGVSSEIEGLSESVISDRIYRADGLSTGQSYSNNVVESRSFDLQGRLQSLSLGTIVQQGFVYDANGNLTQRTPTDGTYQYDALNRLTAEDRANVFAWSYDANANRLSQTLDGQSTNLTYAPISNRLTAVAGNTITLDAAGNTLDDGINAYTYYDNGRLASVIQSGQSVASYFYNGNFQRSRKQLLNRTVIYHYDIFGNLIAESVDGSITRGYLYINNELVALYNPNEGQSQGGSDCDGTSNNGRDGDTPENCEVSGGESSGGSGDNGSGRNNGRGSSRTANDGRDPVATPGPNPSSPLFGMYYVHNDHLNTPRWVTNSTGSLVWRWRSDAFGNSAPLEDVDGNGTNLVLNMRFPGQYYDQESGLHYNWNRYYDAEIGRYITSDPIGLEGGPNTFEYAYSNSLSWFDNDGLKGRGGIPLHLQRYYQNVYPRPGHAIGVGTYNPAVTNMQRARVGQGFRNTLRENREMVDAIGGIEDIVTVGLEIIKGPVQFAPENGFIQDRDLADDMRDGKVMLIPEGLKPIPFIEGRCEPLPPGNGTIEPFVPRAFR